MSTWTKNQKLKGIREKQPGAKGLLRKKDGKFTFFKNSRQDMFTNFYQKRKARTTCSEIKSDWTYIFDIASQLLLMNFNGFG